MTKWRRDEEIDSLRRNPFDLVVIGAGMTGAGVAVDAASRGLRVALIDQGDVASGTSSKSSKLVHGGLRYLQQREFALVYENLRERQRLLSNAPYLVQPLPFLIPLFGSNGVATRTVVKGYATALRLYDLTGGWRIGHRYQRVTRADALRYLPTLRTDRLVAGFLYYDARGDDARVALTLVKTARALGATAINYVRATGVTRDHAGQLSGVKVTDQCRGSSFTIATRTAVNASGVWADEIFTMTEGQTSRRVRPAKGVHLTVARERLPAEVAAVINVPGDRRSIFIVPFSDAPYTFIGTTDTAHEGSLDDPLCTRDDLEYLLGAVNSATSSNLTVDDVTALWAGLRPLIEPPAGQRISERTADLSRRHRVTDSRDGVVHVTGGKWTTYRQMAEDTVDALRPYFSNLPRARTRRLSLHGVGPWRPSGPVETHLYHRYGADVERLIEMIREKPELGDALIEGQSYLAVEFLFAAREEIATSLVDLVTRRTRAHLHDARATLRAAPAIANLVAEALGWTEADVTAQVSEYHELVVHEFSAAGLEL